MTKFAEMTLEHCCRVLAGREPAPGGGSAAAVAGALGAGLLAMVARLTVGRPKYQASWESMKRVRDRGDVLYGRFLELADRDAAAYGRVMDAFKLPQDDEAAKARRSEAIQEATLGAARAPMETLRTAEQCLELAAAAVDHGNVNCLTDAGVAVSMIRTAAVGAAYNVKINLGSLRDEQMKSRFWQESQSLQDRVEHTCRELADKIENRLAQ